MKKYVRLVLPFLVLAAPSACSSPASQPEVNYEIVWEAVEDLSTASIRSLASGEQIPQQLAWGSLESLAYVGVKKAPGLPDAWFVMMQPGIVAMRDTNRDETHVFLDLSEELPNERYWNEEGMSGLEFHPRFLSGEPYVYISVFLPPPQGYGGEWNVPWGGTLEVRRYTCEFTPEGPRAIVGSEIVLLSFETERMFHHSGTLLFASDETLFISTGDGGLRDTAQDPFSLTGKILRIDVSAASAENPYLIPVDNPFADGIDAAPEIWAMGFRNPWQFALDYTETLGIFAWVSDVGGQDSGEISIVLPGDNAGWPVYEATRLLVEEEPPNVVGGPYRKPIVELSEALGCAVAGGMIYAGNTHSALQGTYFYGDTCSGWTATLDRDTAFAALEAGDLVSPRLNAQTEIPFPVAFMRDESGEVYAVSYAGEVYRISEVVGYIAEPPPTRLSATRYQDVSAPFTPPANAHAFAPRLSFFSDGADKTRWLFLPEGERVAVDSSGALKVPVGTEFVKVMERNGRLLETRILQRRSESQWQMYSYVWNENGTEATLATEATPISGSDPAWTVPAQAECLGCHTRASGRVLGFQLAQLQHVPEGASLSELDRLIEAEVFVELSDTAWNAAKAAAGVVTTPEDTAASIEDRARSYLHVNCAHCHMPGSTGSGAADFRLTTAAENMNVCDVAPVRAEDAPAGTRLLAPGSKEDSYIYQRVDVVDSEAGMPPLRTTRDDTGATLIGDWIDNQLACP